FSMLVLLPQEGKQLQDVVPVLKEGDYWAHFTSGLHNAEVELSLPKFKTEYSKRLNDILIDKMGMGIAFSNAADFSRMSDQDANISFVKQDTYIGTDEEGTEAAAVTVVG
ncbi:MAG TPA: serpin family protein, partial [Porphyromonadaceae bacterium]|nr:serpin family protein [Porphyromonadaceae bacterium]